MKRFELRIGKFGHYFHDTTFSIDMTLEMILNKLNYYEKELNRQKELYRKQEVRVIHLERKLTLIGAIE